MAWKRITINVEPELAALAKKRARHRRQSVASYFASLLEADIKAHAAAGEDEQAQYGNPATISQRDEADEVLERVEQKEQRQVRDAGARARESEPGRLASGKKPKIPKQP